MAHKIIDSSLKSILNVTIPMVLSTMSVSLMHFTDRVMLAGYSINSMNAAIIASNFVSIFIMMFIGISDTAEVFVGQYNGSKQYNKLVTPVWQMIYLSLATSAIFIPISYFSDRISMIPDYCLKEGLEYQRILLYCGALSPLRVALSTFFIGQGKTSIITISVIVGAVLNIALDYILIYGITGLIPDMGCRGASIATVISEFVQIIILSVVFFNSKNRKTYKTFENRKFNKVLFKNCIKIGAPMSFGNFVSMSAWYVLQVVVSHVSKDAATVYNIGVVVYMFFIFVGEGINKAIAAICSNMIGQGDLKSIEKTRKIFVIISFAFGVIIAIPLIGFPQWVLHILNLPYDDMLKLYSDIKIVFALVTATATLETILFSTFGILIAGGDTKYVMMIYQICLWVFIVFPTITLYYMRMLNSVPIVFVFMIIWLVITQFFLQKRYKSLKWYNKLV